MKCIGIEKTFFPLSSIMRHKIRVVYRPLVDRPSPLNQERRAALSEAIFKVENDLEHRQPKHPQVAAMRMVRNRLYDDLGWNEYAKTKSTKHSKGVSHAN